MAMIELKDKRRLIIAPDRALAIWKAMNGEIKPTSDQAEYIRQIRRVYLNWRDAPLSYRRAYRKEISRLNRWHQLSLNLNEKPEMWYDRL